MLLTLKVNHFSSFVFNMGIIIKIGFPGGSVVKNPPANARDLGLIPGLGKSPGVGSGNPLQYSCLGNLLDKEPGEFQSMGLQRVRQDLAAEHRLMRTKMY